MNTLSNIEKACDENDGIKNYIAAYGGLNHVKKVILVDFFRFGFDGSGGFNDFEAGSCIDGNIAVILNLMCGFIHQFIGLQVDLRQHGIGVQSLQINRIIPYFA